VELQGTAGPDTDDADVVESDRRGGVEEDGVAASADAKADNVPALWRRLLRRHAHEDTMEEDLIRAVLDRDDRADVLDSEVAGRDGLHAAVLHCACLSLGARVGAVPTLVVRRELVSNTVAHFFAAGFDARQDGMRSQVLLLVTLWDLH